MMKILRVTLDFFRPPKVDFTEPKFGHTFLCLVDNSCHEETVAQSSKQTAKKAKKPEAIVPQTVSKTFLC